MSVVETSDSDSSARGEYELYSMIGTTDAMIENVNIDGISLAMEVDTGSAVTIISETTFNKHWFNKDKVWATNEVVRTPVRTYTGETVSISGIIDVVVSQKEGQSKRLPMMIVPGNGPNFLG